MDYNDIKAKLAFKYAESFTLLASPRQLLLKLPAQAANTNFGAWLSVSAKIINVGTGVLTLTEGVSVVGDGTGIAPVCLSRLDTPPACPVSTFHTPNTPSGGTIIDRAAGSTSEPAEMCHWILKPLTNYLIELTPTSTPTGVLSFVLRNIPSADYLYNRHWK